MTTATSKGNPEEGTVGQALPLSNHLPSAFHHKERVTGNRSRLRLCGATEWGCPKSQGAMVPGREGQSIRLGPGEALVPRA